MCIGPEDPLHPRPKEPDWGSPNDPLAQGDDPLLPGQPIGPANLGQPPDPLHMEIGYPEAAGPNALPELPPDSPPAAETGSNFVGHNGDLLDQVEKDVDTAPSHTDVLDEVERSIEGRELEATKGTEGMEQDGVDFDDQLEKTQTGIPPRTRDRSQDVPPPGLEADEYSFTRNYAWPKWARLWAKSHKMGHPTGSTTRVESDQETPLAFCLKRREFVPLSQCASCDEYEPQEGENPGAACRHLAPPDEPDEPEAQVEEPDSETEAEETAQDTPPLASYCNLREREVAIGECQECRDFDRPKGSTLCWHITFKLASDEDEESGEDDSD